MLSIVAIVVAPYLKTKTPPTSEMLKFVVANEPADPVVFWFNVGNVQLAKLPEAGVPNAGVTSVGEVANTTAPEPVVELILIFGAVPPEEAKGDEAVTPVTVPVPGFAAAIV